MTPDQQTVAVLLRGKWKPELVAAAMRIEEAEVRELCNLKQGVPT